jgi:alkyldihydroxyacetonephosphate synthase
MVAMIHELLAVPTDGFDKPANLGLDLVPDQPPATLIPEHRRVLAAIVGEDNIQTDGYHRLRASYGQGMIDSLRLRSGVIENLPDVVVHPRSPEDITRIVRFCHQERIPLYVVSGRSSVTRGFEAVQGGVTLDMSTHMNKVLAINETNQTVTVQPGIFGPALETALNHAAERFGCRRNYTCGHFPQSFQFSTVGGWVATRGAGQNSTYYGKIEGLVIAQEVVTPAGTIATQPYPRQATGPDLNQILTGSEGTFGVLVEVTLKIFRHQPENTRRFSYMFRTWDQACRAAREIMQSEAGYPSVFRISDPEETDVAMQMYNLAGTPAEAALAALGYRTGEKCLLIGTADGDRRLTRAIHRNVRQVCRSYGAFPLTAFGVVQRWEHSRFLDPYLRDDLADFGVIIDTLECSVTWESLPAVHAGVREVVKAKPHTVCMTHISHFYPQGANLYFIFITRCTDREDYLRLQYTVLQAIRDYGGSASHHHGVGKAFAPWLPDQLGDSGMAVLHALKGHFDPHGIMNPGGTLGLDLTAEQRSKRWGLTPRTQEED